jgi:hypothetical protein
MARKLAEVTEPQNFEREYSELQSLYQFDNPDEIRPFLERKPHLVKLLRDAKFGRLNLLLSKLRTHLAPLLIPRLWTTQMVYIAMKNRLQLYLSAANCSHEEGGCTGSAQIRLGG